MVAERTEISRPQKPRLAGGKSPVWPRSFRERNGYGGQTSQNGDIELVESIEQYLIEIGRIPLLTPKQEKIITSKIRLGQKAWMDLTIVSGFENLDHDLKTRVKSVVLAGLKIVDTKNLDWTGYQIDPFKNKDLTEERIFLVEEGIRFFDQLINSNLRLVVAVAKKYLSNEFPLLDLVQEGNIGLMRAALKFDPDLDNRFSTYATWWIRQTIQRAKTDKARAVRLPTHLHERATRIAKTSETLSQQLQREPSVAEIAKNMKMSPSQVSAALTPDTVSLETEIGNDGESDLTEIIPDPTQDIEEAATKNELKERVWEALDCLFPRERKVIRLRFGLEDGRSRTLQEVGGEFQVTRERIRQIEAKALRKLRKSPKAARLAVYLS